MSVVFLVDDCVDVLDLYTQVLEEMGHRVYTARDGRAALDVLSTLRPDLVITDVSMPRMNGLELCERIRQTERLQGVPIIVHSGEVNLRARCNEVVLSKPCDPEDFMRLVSQQLAGPLRRPEHGLAA